MNLIFLFAICFVKSCAFSGGPTSCPNRCSGQGTCTNGTSGCICFPGFIGVDCSIRLCPSAKAWVDNPYADNLAHADFTECSNMVIIRLLVG